MELTKNERIKLFEYMWKSGFLIQAKSFIELKTEKERLERLRSLINNGYRIQLFGNKFDVINIKGVCISQELIDELTEAYNYLKGDIK